MGNTLVDAMTKILLFALFVTFPSYVFAGEKFCIKGEILIQSHYVNSYSRKNGVLVSGYFKNEYCRTSLYPNNVLSFKPEKPQNWLLNEKFKDWTNDEIEKFLKLLDSLPTIFKQQLLKSIHRGIISENPLNPASTLPFDGEIIIYDKFFKEKDQARILSHELAHLWYWTLTNNEKQTFGQLAGWSFDSKSHLRIKSKESIYPDSKDSPSEDFANNAEAYYYDFKKQHKFDLKLQDYFRNLSRGEK